jgi:site-specific recombinase XerD
MDIETVIIAALKHAGIMAVKFHNLNHPFSSHFDKRGGSLKALQEILGHSNIKTTMRYAHIGQGHKKEAVKLLVCSEFGLTQHPMPSAVI